MKRKKLVCGICASVITMAMISAVDPVDANGFTELPAAGIAVVLGEGTAYDELQGTVEAYNALNKQTAENNILEITTNTAVEVIRASDESKETGNIVETAPITVVKAETETEHENKSEVWNADSEVAVLLKDVSELTPTEMLEVPGVDVSVEDSNAEYANLVIAQVDRYVNVRSEANADSEVLGKLYDNSVGTLLEEVDGWYQIQSGNVTGYVSAEFCVTGDQAVELVDEVGTRIATVKTDALKVREEASLEASVLGLVPNEEDLTVLEEIDGWVKVAVEEGDGYVSAEYVELRTDFVQAESKEEEEKRLAKEAEARRVAQAAAQRTTTSFTKTTEVPVISGGSDMGRAVAEYACQFVGNPYVYGGTSLTNGADCSGFVMSVYANFGVSLPHSSKADRTQGYAVDSLANAQPGDLICYSGHVALYIGNNQIVHASSSKTGIIISNADYKAILAIRRIF